MLWTELMITDAEKDDFGAFIDGEWATKCDLTILRSRSFPIVVSVDMVADLYR